jgi:hypothetical protein
MAQSLELNIKTTSDVPQAMEKAKAATTGLAKQVGAFEKQVGDIGRKFGTSFKDIFLSFLGPMALVTGAMALIGKMIADNERKRAEANQAAIDGTNELMSAEDKYWARKNEREKQTAKAIEEAKTARENTTQEFLEKDPRGQEMLKELQFKSMSDPMGLGRVAFSKQKDIQDKVQALIGGDAAKANWEETQRKQKLAAERIRKEEEEAKVKAAKQTGKEGLSAPNSISGNIIGVGQNPVVTALQEQQAIQREQLAYLQIIASNKTASPAADVTASGATPSTPANASPSRAALLTKNK